MRVSSPDFEDGGFLPKTAALRGENRRPTLEIAEAPVDTTSLAVIVHDPDAPGTDFTHWLVWNLPPDTATIPSDKLPSQAVEGTTDFGKVGFGGPAPPSGTHHYLFEIYALSATIDLPATTTRDELLQIIDGLILDQAKIVGLFSA